MGGSMWDNNNTALGINTRGSEVTASFRSIPRVATPPCAPLPIIVTGTVSSECRCSANLFSYYITAYMAKTCTYQTQKALAGQLLQRWSVLGRQH